jgi:site-specific recombinase XerD
MAGGYTMKEYIFQSSLADRMKAFVALKRFSGNDYTTRTLILKYFDQFLARKKFKLKYLTRKLYEQYVATLSHLDPHYRSDQCSVIRQFSIYLSRFEPRCYIPDIVPSGRPQDDWRAFIFTKDQIRNLLAAAGKLGHGWFRPHTYRTLFGLLYTTGLRIGEALALNIEDFYPETLRIHVRTGKFRKSRWVPLSISTGKVLTKYVFLRKQVITKESATSPLFISIKRSRLDDVTVYHTFCKLLQQCGIHKSRKHGPRIHDIRHTFACHRLLEWYRDGQDINARLPALATYMGHVWISSTQIYIQATPELHEYANQRFLNYVRGKKIIKGGQS